MGAGLLPVSAFLQSLGPFDSCSWRPGAAAYGRAEPQPHPGRLREELMHAHGHEADQPENKNGLHKEVSMFTQSVHLCQHLKKLCVSEWVGGGARH